MTANYIHGWKRKHRPARLKRRCNETKLGLGCLMHLVFSTLIIPSKLWLEIFHFTHPFGVAIFQ